MPLLTCSSWLLFNSPLLPELSLNVCVYFGCSVRTVLSTKDGLCECILTSCWCLNFLHFLSHWLQQHWCALLVISASNFFSLCIAVLSCSVPVLQLWPLLCDLYDISDSAHLFFLYFDFCLRFISSALCLMRSCALTAHAEDGGPDFLMFTQMCFISGAVLDEQNLITLLYVFIELWLPLFLLHIYSISLCVFAAAHCFMKSFCECLFSPPGCPFF